MRSYLMKNEFPVLIHARKWCQNKIFLVDEFKFVIFEQLNLQIFQNVYYIQYHLNLCDYKIFGIEKIMYNMKVSI